jgi:hypothetical protein
MGLYERQLKQMAGGFTGMRFLVKNDNASQLRIENMTTKGGIQWNATQ